MFRSCSFVFSGLLLIFIRVLIVFILLDSYSTRVHSCSLVLILFTHVLLVFTLLDSRSTRVHSCSLVCYLCSLLFTVESKTAYESNNESQQVTTGHNKSKLNHKDSKLSCNESKTIYNESQRVKNLTCKSE